MNNELCFYLVSFVRCAYDNPAVSFHNLRLKILGKLPIFFPNFLRLEQSSGCAWTIFWIYGEYIVE